MKLITLWEPWSTLMALSDKKIETRGWRTNYRGPVAIHSAKGGMSQKALASVCLTSQEIYNALHAAPLFSALASKMCATGNGNTLEAFPHRGHIIAVGNLIDCVRSESYRCAPGVFDDYPELDTPQERAFGNYEPGRFGLVFENVKRLHSPIPFKSRQGKLLDIDPALEALISAQLAA